MSFVALFALVARTRERRGQEFAEEARLELLRQLRVAVGLVEWEVVGMTVEHGHRLLLRDHWQGSLDVHNGGIDVVVILLDLDWNLIDGSRDVVWR